VTRAAGYKAASRLGLADDAGGSWWRWGRSDPLDAGVVPRAPRSRTAVRGGVAVRGALYGGSAADDAARFSADEKLREVEKPHDVAGVLVCDKWVATTNGSRRFFF